MDYESFRESIRARGMVVSAKGRDIGSIPPVANPSRKLVCELDFRAFCETYFPMTYTIGWSEDHLRVIERIEGVVLSGGMSAIAMPRGSGKTSLCESACLWSTFYGHRRYVLLLGANQESSEEMLASIKVEVESNPLLLQDFPEICFPVSRLEGMVGRCAGQTHLGERTRIFWGTRELCLPDIPGSVARGGIIAVKSITSGIRGTKAKRPDGTSVRPDMVVIDDPQTDESARSIIQCHVRERILAGAVIGMAGPGMKIAAVMPCTVIRSGDVADNLLDRQKHPEWRGERTKMVYSFPTNQSLWDTYADIWRDELRAGRSIRAATDYYVANRERMDEGARVSWAERHREEEVSAIQHAMNLRLEDEAAFFAEYQNEPKRPSDASYIELRPDDIMARVNGFARGEPPVSTVKITAFCDVQKDLLYWVVCAWDDDFTGYVLDYGAWPDQGRDYFSAKSANPSISHATSAMALAKGERAPGFEGGLYVALGAVVDGLASKGWTRGDGSVDRCSRIGIDANWGEVTDLVYAFARASVFSTLITPAHGKYSGARSIPFSEYRKKDGDRVGLNWRIPAGTGRPVRHVLYDSNGWKSFLRARLETPKGDRGSLTLFGTREGDHRMLADHLLSEYRVKTHGRGRDVDEWSSVVNRPENHYLDCLVGCFVLASVEGVALSQMKTPTSEKKKKVSFADMQRAAKKQRLST